MKEIIEQLEIFNQELQSLISSESDCTKYDLQLLSMKIPTIQKLLKMKVEIFNQ